MTWLLVPSGLLRELTYVRAGARVASATRTGGDSVYTIIDDDAIRRSERRSDRLMSVLVRDRRDITLEAVYAVAWQGAGLEIAPEALELMDRCHESFEAHVADRVRAQPDALIYGVTSAPGDSAASALSPEGQAQRPSQLWTAMSFGEPLPARVVRAIVVALVAEAAGAPDEHYAPELEQLWGDEHEAAALRSMRRLLEGSARERQAHQASVSLRILPRVLGAGFSTTPTPD